MAGVLIVAGSLLARWRSPSEPGCCAVMTCGGISLFVVTVAVFPIGVTLFRQADINQRLIPAAIVLGSFTFTNDHGLRHGHRDL